MQAIIFDGRLRFVTNQPMPELKSGWALIRVLKSGICRTDLEITKGYMGFKGVLGHEFVGIVEKCDDPKWIGKRVVGEINAACGSCDWCRQDLGRHCPNRTTLGIQTLDGCMADYCTLPVANLFEVPAALTDDAAVFVEPLSAACEILDQVSIGRSDRCVVLGDGKLGILCAWMLSTKSDEVTLIGHHPAKLDLARLGRIRTVQAYGTDEGAADIVVEATGRPEGLSQAMAICRPRGTLVLKSTIASQGELNLAAIVINEITMIGSRCGLFSKGLAAVAQYKFPVERLITARFPIRDGLKAFQVAAQNESVKVLVEAG